MYPILSREIGDFTFHCFSPPRGWIPWNIEPIALALFIDQKNEFNRHSAMRMPQSRNCVPIFDWNVKFGPLHPAKTSFLDLHCAQKRMSNINRMPTPSAASALNDSTLSNGNKRLRFKRKSTITRASASGYLPSASTTVEWSFGGHEFPTSGCFKRTSVPPPQIRISMRRIHKRKNEKNEFHVRCGGIFRW